MSKEYKEFLLVTPRNLIESEIGDVIEESERNYNPETDMYNGGLQGCEVGRLVKEYEGHTVKQIQRNERNFSEISYDFAEMNVMNYAVLGRKGYMAYIIKPIITGISSKGYELIKESTYDREKFRTQSELKRAVEFNPLRWYKASVCDGSGNRIGQVGLEKHVYKTKPKKCPERYDFLEENLVVIYFGKVLV